MLYVARTFLPRSKIGSDKADLPLQRYKKLRKAGMFY